MVQEVIRVDRNARAESNEEIALRSFLMFFLFSDAESTEPLHFADVDRRRIVRSHRFGAGGTSMLSRMFMLAWGVSA